jgi:hypothetical protein
VSSAVQSPAVGSGDGGVVAARGAGGRRVALGART